MAASSPSARIRRSPPPLKLRRDLAEAPSARRRVSGFRSGAETAARPSGRADRHWGRSRLRSASTQSPTRFSTPTSSSLPPCTIPERYWSQRSARSGPSWYNASVSLNSNGPKCTSASYALVRPAAKLQIRNGRFSTISEGHDMVELEQAALAAPAVCSDKSASPTVALPHFPFDRRRHMAGAGSRIRLSPRPSGLRDLLLLEFRQQHRQDARTFSSNR